VICSIIECLKHPKAVAWGECGLDFFKNNSDPDIQKSVFAQQLIKAVELKKPIIVHSRNAEEDSFTILKAHVPMVRVSLWNSY
jgi:TatD DNase family protein